MGKDHKRLSERTKAIPLQQYITEKIMMLEDDFYFKLTDEEKEYFYALHTEFEVDQYAHDFFLRNL